ncbi:MAG: threonine/serine exporter family protein [Lachnospiraceae bacterium]|nr:threonine/serine exporter family protein [Lachnospiraceae bacterium]
MNYKLLMDTAMLAGEIMLGSDAEINRVEDTMMHILKNAKNAKVEVYVMMLGIMATLDCEFMDPITLVRQVDDVGGLNLSKIVKVNDISRRFCGGEISLESAYKELTMIRGKQYNSTTYNLCTIGVAVGFVLMFGGTITDVLVTAMVGSVLAAIITIGRRIGINSVILNATSSFCIALVATILQTFIFTSVNLDIVIISSIMLLVPGVAITNAVRDILACDYLSGGARILKAFLTAAAIAIGTGAGMALFKFIFGGR